ncbi:MAG: prepilin-type N-terminal cleavage/methylation domain-containing protein [Clostridia bacterium]|nr:prepilin-type N-terminal cleavage/methylation domain-containing protein [Clostridia bacterium]
MKKTQKGLTLVEVLVAITVLSITMFALLSTIVAMRKVVARQEEYVKIKMVCQDIDAYWDKYGDAWADKYFEGEYEANNFKGYLTSKFYPVTNYNKNYYKIEFSYDDSSKLIIGSIESPDGKELVKELNLGVSASQEVTNEQE